MKKLALALAFLMIIPGAAFGLEMMNDSSLDDVSGQSGVSIAMDDVQIFMNIDRVAWLDCDGYACGTGDGEQAAGGAVGISNFQLDVLNINAPDTIVTKTGGDSESTWQLANTTECSNIGLQYDYGQTAPGIGCSLAVSGDSDWGSQNLGLNNYQSPGGEDTDSDLINEGGAYLPAALTIDATSQLPVLSYVHTQAVAAGINTDTNDNGNVGGVLIGIPTLEIHIPTLSLTPGFYNVDNVAEGGALAGGEEAYNTVENGYDYGTIALEGITMTTLSGWIEIAPH